MRPRRPATIRKSAAMTTIKQQDLVESVAAALQFIS